MSKHLIFHRVLKCFLSHYVLIDFISYLFVLINILTNTKVKPFFLHQQFVLQQQHIYTITQQFQLGMGSLRRTFQLRLVAGRSHYCLCSWCLSGTYKLRPRESPESQSNCHNILHSCMFLSAR
jgi:hypothetical protein